MWLMRGLSYTDSVFWVIRCIPIPTPIAMTEPAIISFPTGMSSPGVSLLDTYIVEIVPNVPIPVASNARSNVGFILITHYFEGEINLDLISRFLQ